MKNPLSVGISNKIIPFKYSYEHNFLFLLKKSLILGQNSKKKLKKSGPI